MTRKKENTAVFYPAEFGKVLREERRSAGFTSTPKFSEAIKEDTGIFIDPDTLHKIERGERETDPSKLIAISITISNRKAENWILVVDRLLSNSVPLEIAFKDEHSSLERSYIEKYKERFETLPSVKHVESATDIHIGASQVYGTKEEKNFAAEFRNNSEDFKLLQVGWSKYGMFGYPPSEIKERIMNYLNLAEKMENSDNNIKDFYKSISININENPTQ